MAKLIFLEDAIIQKVFFKKGVITNGEISDKGEIYLYDDYSNVEDPEQKSFMERYFSIRAPYGTPIMNLEDFREQQIKSVLDGD